MSELYITCCLWQANIHSPPNSRCFDASWVEKLYRGFKRNLTVPFRFIAFVDREYRFAEPAIDQIRLMTYEPDFGALTEPYRLDEPMILCGLDTIVVRNVDHFAEYCLTADRICLPRDPYKPEQSINGVQLVPKGHRHVFDHWRGENDMVWLRRFRTDFFDDIWPGQVVSLKAHKVRDVGLRDARIVYCHGQPKPHQLSGYDWVREHWR